MCDGRPADGPSSRVFRNALLTIAAVGTVILAIGVAVAWRADRAIEASSRYQNADRVRFPVDFGEVGSATATLRMPGRVPFRTAAGTVLAVACDDDERPDLVRRLAPAAARVTLTDPRGERVLTRPLEFPHETILELRGLACGLLPESRPNPDGGMLAAESFAGDFRLTVDVTAPAPRAGRRDLIVYDRLYEFEFIDSWVRYFAGAAVAVVGGLILAVAAAAALLRRRLRDRPGAAGRPAA